MAAHAAAAESKVWRLEAESELRFEVGADTTLTVALRSGSIELLGIELATNREYSFTADKLALFTWHGATLETRGETLSIYESKRDSAMISYVNTHAQLEARREAALRVVRQGVSGPPHGPRVMLVGPTDSGKSSVSSILLSYAVRLGRTPTFVELDVGLGAVTVPGTISAVPMDASMLSIEEGFGLGVPLGYFYGHQSPQENPELYKRLVTSLAAQVNARCAKEPDADASGLIINTCGWIDGDGYQILLHTAQAFSADVLLVMGHDRLYAELCADLQSQNNPNSPVVVKLPRSGGVVQRDQSYRRARTKQLISEYFYGAAQPPGAAPAASDAGGATPQPMSQLSPFTRELNFSEIELFRVGGVQLSSSSLPVGHKSSLEPAAVRLTRVTPSPELMHSVLAFCHMPENIEENDESQPGALAASTTTAQRLLNTNIAGFVCVQEVRMERGSMTVLAPCAEMPPSKYMLLGTLKWME